MSGILTASQEIGLGPQPIPLCNNQKEEDQESRRAFNFFCLLGQIISPSCLSGPRPIISSTLVFMGF